MTINTEDEYRAAWARTRDLMMRCPDPPGGSPEAEELLQLSAAIWQYEAIHYPT